MATSEFTAHYHIDKYAATDKPNLRDQYNAAMDKIDDALYTANTNATDAKATAQRAEGAVSGKASQADLDTLSTAVSGKASQADLSALSQTVSGKASQADLSALSALLPSGQFSAQSTVKQALDALGARIDALAARKKMIVIGDSFSSASQAGTPLWYTYVAQHYGLDVYTNASDGMGFVPGPNTFMVQAVTAKNNLNADDVERIYVVGGLNDIRSSGYNLENTRVAARDLMIYLKTNFPNAKRYLYGPESFPDVLNTAGMLTQWLAWYSTQFEYEYHDMTLAFQFYNGFFGGQTGQNPHPTAEGEKIIARYILNHGNLDNGYWTYDMTYSGATQLRVIYQGVTQSSSCIKYTSMRKLGNNFIFELDLDATQISGNSDGTLRIELPYKFSNGIKNNYAGGLSESSQGVHSCAPKISQLYANKMWAGWLADDGAINFNVALSGTEKPVVGASASGDLRIEMTFSM